MISLALAAATACGSSDDAGDETGGPDDGGCGGICPGDLVCRDGLCVRDGFSCIDEDGDGYGTDCDDGDDCDDTDPDINPGVREVCGDGRDNDCNGLVDDRTLCQTCEDQCRAGEVLCVGDSIQTCELRGTCRKFVVKEICGDGTVCRDATCRVPCTDADGDGWPSDCGIRRDCDDADPDVFPDAPEVCDRKDNDCDGNVDEGFVCDEPCEDACVSGASVCSADGRGYRRCADGLEGCTIWGATIPCGGDTICSGAGLCVDRPRCFDPDGDGRGPACEAGDDCEPFDARSGEGATEVCDGLDNDCDGSVDEGGVCDTCAATVSVTGSGTLWTVPCGTEGQLVEVRSAGTGQVSVAAQSTAAFELEAGTRAGGRFSATTQSFALGEGRGLVAPASGGTLWLRVRSTASGVPVQLAVSADGAGACVGDRLEPNNAPSFATTLPSLPVALNGTICTGDQDYLAPPTTTGGVIVWSLATDGRTGGTVAAVLQREAPNGATEAVTIPVPGPPSTSGGPMGRSGHFRTDLPGSWRLRIFGPTAADTNDWALTMRAVSPPSCTDDADDTGARQNDSVATSVRLQASQTHARVLCPGDWDVWDIGDIAVGKLVQATLDHPDAGNLDISIVHGSISGLIQDRSTDGTSEFVNINISRADRYHLVVRGRTVGDAGPYTLRYEIR